MAAKVRRCPDDVSRRRAKLWYEDVNWIGHDIRCAKRQSDTKVRDAERHCHNAILVRGIENLDAELCRLTGDRRVRIDADFRFRVDRILGAVNRDGRAEDLAEAADQLALDEGFHIHDGIAIRR